MSLLEFSDLMDSFNHHRYNLKYLFDKLPIATVITDSRGIILYYNQAQSHMDGIEPSEALGKKETDIYDFHYHLFPDVHQICQKRGRPILGFVWPYYTKHGKTIDAAYWVFPIFRNNLVIGSLCFTQPVATARATARAAGVKKEKQPPIEWPEDTPISLVTRKLVGGNLDFQRALNTAQSTASSPSPVLITGETGTGKELFARFIHETSLRADKQFMAINCSAIPGSLLEGILFGTAKGSFTGAVDRAGLFEEANGGTLFLDEMDSMPLELQPKLLRVLQEMRSRRIGSSTEVELDLKIITSVGGSLAHALSGGRLRPDLFYRLAVIIIEIPPLRQRLDDLEALLNYFINKYNKQIGKQCCNFSESLMNYFRKYSWPGNIRELEHLVAGAINLSQEGDETLDYHHLPIHYQRMFDNLSNQGGCLEADDLPWAASPEESDADRSITFLGQVLSKAVQSEILEEPAAGQDRSPQSPPPTSPASPKRIGKYQEIDQMVEALVKSRGNVAEASRRLGLSRQLLDYRMKKYGLKRDNYLL